jgi:CRP-like cAMP-binding protein
MEAVDPGTELAAPGWVSRLVEVLQPVSVRADRLGSLAILAGLGWPDLEFAAGLLRETLIERGTRMTVQGRPSSRLWLISEGEALVSADARPIKVAGRGDTVGLAALLCSVNSLETTIALTSIRAFEAGPAELGQLIGRRSIRRRLEVSAGEQLRARRPSRRPSSRERVNPGS